MKKETIIQCSAPLVIILFVYTASSKLINPASFRYTLSQLPVIGFTWKWMAYALPVAEIMIALLLIHPHSRRFGFTSAFILLSVFTVYLIAIVLYNSELPCSCGGVISALSWPQHIVFNLLFMCVSLLGSHLTKNVVAIHQAKPKTC